MTTTATVATSEFLAVLNVVIPESANPAEVDRVRTAQGARVKELTAAGYILRLWEAGGGRHFFNVRVGASTFVANDRMEGLRRELRAELPGFGQCRQPAC